LNKQNENTERLTDKAFLRLVLSSIFGLLMCLFCLCSTTWAWFSDNAPSRHNEIKTAEKCLVSVSVSKEETIGTANINTPFEKNLASGEYTVTMTLPKDSASAYLVITVGSDESTAKKYYTDYIERHNDAQEKTLTFKIIVTEDAMVTITPRWGIYSGDSNVTADASLTIPENN